MEKIRIKVQYIPVITDVTQTEAEEVVLENSSVGGLLLYLGERYGERMKQMLWDLTTLQRSQFVLTVVNGDLVHAESFPLHEGDTVLIMPALAGG